MREQNPSLDFQQLSDDKIESTLAQYNIALSVDEAKTIQDLLQRPPTLAECMLWGIQGSEHCSYKSSKKHLKQLPTEGPNVILGAKEDAGIVRIATDENGRHYDIAVSHESHNHPSQIEPVGGAATGVGGNVRDVCCMGAQVIAHADSLRFGDIKHHKSHWIYEGVIEGIASYGNAIGIANMAGDCQFDASFNDNCLVTAVTLGLLPENRLLHSYPPEGSEDYDLILVGQPTDRSGFGGASFASEGLDDNESEKLSAVQDPNAFLGRVLLKANYSLFEKLESMNVVSKVGFKDLGAGGISCASVEMADSVNLGAEIWLDKVPTVHDSLPPIVTLCAETQERYLWACPPELTSTILEHYNKTIGLPDISENARAEVIGKIRKDGAYQVHYQNETLIDAKARDICQGLQYDRSYSKPTYQLNEPQPSHVDINEVFIQLLSHENLASRECLYENYDKQVQGRAIIERGQADAGVFALFNDYHSPEALHYLGVALSVAANPRYGQIDPYWAAINAVVEAMFKTVSVGAEPQALTDCLCFGNPEKPEQMWAFVEAVRGIEAACKHITLKAHPTSPTPVIAGNVSFYNEKNGKPISPSPIISCIARILDYRKAITPSFKSTDSTLVLIGPRKNELGGSAYYNLLPELGANLPKPDFAEVIQQRDAVLEAIDQALVLAVKVIHQGGVAVALANMAFENGIGCQVKLTSDQFDETQLLFSETPGFICEVRNKNLDKFRSLMKQFNIKHEVIGQTVPRARLSINTVDVSLKEAKSAWQNGLRNKVS